MLMQGSARWISAEQRTLNAYAGQRALDARQLVLHADAGQLALDANAGQHALDAGTIWQHIQGYIGAFWTAIAANNVGHHSTPAYGCIFAATRLCPSCANNL